MISNIKNINNLVNRKKKLEYLFEKRQKVFIVQCHLYILSIAVWSSKVNLWWKKINWKILSKNSFFQWKKSSKIRVFLFLQSSHCLPLSLLFSLFLLYKPAWVPNKRTQIFLCQCINIPIKRWKYIHIMKGDGLKLRVLNTRAACKADQLIHLALFNIVWSHKCFHVSILSYRHDGADENFALFMLYPANLVALPNLNLSSLSYTIS